MFKVIFLLFTIAVLKSLACIDFENIKGYVSHKQEPFDTKSIKSYQDLVDRSTVAVKENNISVLCANAFGNLPHVQELILTDNNIEKVEIEAFKNLTALEGLYLDQNRITTIENGFLKYLPQLSTLSLAMNGISRVQNEIFNGTVLKSLQLSYNPIYFIHEEAFDNMEYLETLYLGRNLLTEISPKWLKNCSRLWYIDLSENRLSKLPPYSFQSVVAPNVSIYLHTGLIEHVDVSAFKNLKSINDIDLAYNRISELDDDMFSHLDMIYDLNLNSNRLACLHTEFLGNLRGIGKLRLQYNQLDKMCAKRIQDWCDQHNVFIEIYIEPDD